MDRTQDVQLLYYYTKINYLLFHKFEQLINDAFNQLTIIPTLVTTTVHAMKL